jgi:hypothetical protein
MRDVIRMMQSRLDQRGAGPSDVEFEYEGDVPAHSSGSGQTWTFLFYDDADFSNAYNPFGSFVQDALSRSNVNVLVLEDREYGPCKLWYVDKYHQPVLLETWGELNMGHFSTLGKFIRYGKTQYTADRYLLALYDHGGGWIGACTDVTDQDWLTMQDISLALTYNGGVDIIAFTAPCLMGAIESAYQLRNCADVYIGSEEISGYIDWRGTMGDICRMLNNSSGLTNVDVGRMIIDLVADNALQADSVEGAEWIAMSAVQTDKTGEVIKSVDGFCRNAIPRMAGLFDCIRPAARGAWRMGMGGQIEVGEIDLYDFAAKLAGVASDAVVEEHARKILNSLDEAVIAHCRGDAQDFTGGLSIYFPRLVEDYNSNYTTVNLDFVDDTHWDEFLQAYYEYEASVPVTERTWGGIKALYR